MLYFLALYIFALYPSIRADTNYQKCLEVNTFGYHYDHLYKLAAHSNGTSGGTTIHFLVKTASDAHILFTSNAAILDTSQDTMDFGRTSRVVEVVLGGGKNSWSTVRAGRHIGINNKWRTLGSKTAPVVSASEYRAFWIRLLPQVVLGAADNRWSGIRYFRTAIRGSFVPMARISTTNIVTAEEYRPFWITIRPKEGIDIGMGNSTEPFLSTPARDPAMERLLQVTYFSVSSWNNVKAHWKINCPEEGESEISGIEELQLTSYQKLRRDVTQFADTSQPPSGVNDTDTIINLALHIHHFHFNEHESKVEMDGRMFMEWHDDAFVWDKKEYDNMTSLLVQPSDIWTPDVDFFGDGAVYAEPGVDSTSAAVLVSSDGTLKWSPEWKVVVVCDVDMAGWPRDQHECIVHLGFASVMLGVYAEAPSGVMLAAVSRPQWMDTGLTSNWDVRYSLHSMRIDGYFYIQLNFSRKLSPYQSIITTPFIGSVAIGLSGMWLQPRNKAKLYLACLSSCLLTLFLTHTANLVPSNAPAPPVIRMYVCGVMLSCLSIVNYVLAHSLLSSKRLPTLPHWFSLILTSPMLQCCLCISSPQRDDDSSYRNIKSESSSPTAVPNSDWILINALFERCMFIVYCGVYASLLLAAS